MALDFKLSKPIKRGDEVFDEIHLRDVTVEDVDRLGFFYSANIDTGDMEIKPRSVIDYLARLSGLPPSTIKQMSPSDFDKCRWILLNFTQGSSPKG